MASITSNLYTQFIIPLANLIVHRLSTFKFKSVLSHAPTYLHDFNTFTERESQHIQDCTHRLESQGALTFLGYAAPFEEHQQSHPVPPEDHSPSMKNGYMDALCAITVSEINPALVNAATYQAYHRLCRILNVHIPLAHFPGKCGVCLEPNGSCECLKHQFIYLQHIPCTCPFGKHGYCVCDDLPEIFCDLDEIRWYQSLVVKKVLSNLFEFNAEMEEFHQLFSSFRLLGEDARRSDYRYASKKRRKLESFEPP